MSLFKGPILILLLASAMLTLLPSPVSAQSGFHLVPCGRSGQTGQDEQCQFRHLVIMLVLLINYLITFAVIVAMYQILSSGFWLMASLGNSETVEKSKKGISHAVVGFAIIVLAFVFINLIANGLLGDPNKPRHWYKANCLYSVSSGCWGQIVTGQ